MANQTEGRSAGAKVRTGCGSATLAGRRSDAPQIPGAIELANRARVARYPEVIRRDAEVITGSVPRLLEHHRNPQKKQEVVYPKVDPACRYTRRASIARYSFYGATVATHRDDQRVRFDTLTAMAQRWKVAGFIAVVCVAGAAYYGLKHRPPTAKPLDGPRPPILVAGVNEPDELRVEPFPLPVLTPPEQAFADELRKPKVPNAKFDMLALVNPVLKSYPDYGDGYAMRATALCEVPATKPADIISDINSAIKYHAKPENASSGELLSIRARLEYAAGQSDSAMTDLENGMKSNLDDAAQIFNNGNVKPSEMPSSQCKWTEEAVNGLVAKAPNDYRSYLYRGLFYTFFAAFDHVSLPTALGNFQKAIDLNGTSALPMEVLYV